MIVIDGAGRVTHRSGDASDGRFIFSDDAPADAIGAPGAKRAIVWTGSGRTVAIPYDDEGAVSEDVDLSEGGTDVRIGKGSRVSHAGEGAPIVIDGADGTRFTIDTAGPQAGILSFETTQPAADLDLSIRYFYPKEGNPQAFEGVRFRIVEPAAAAGTLRVEVRLDPNRLTDPTRTFLTIDTQASYTSTLRTPAGAAITLTPVDGKVIAAMAFDPALGQCYQTPNGAWIIAGNDRPAVMLGLSGAERAALPVNGAVLFVAGGPAFAPSFLQPKTTGVDFPLIAEAQGSKNPVTTAWVYFDTRGLAGQPPSGYYSAPASAPLFTIGAGAVLEPFDPVRIASFDAKKGVHGAPAPSFPAAPYAGFLPPAAQGNATWTLLERFEHELLAPARSRVVQDLGAEGPQGLGSPESFAASAAELRPAITPQGTYSLFDEKGAWMQMDIARSILEQPPFPLEISDIDDPLREALLSNQLFLVISSAQKFSERASTNYRLTEAIAKGLVARNRVPEKTLDLVKSLFDRFFHSRAEFEPELRQKLSGQPGAVVETYLSASQLARLNVAGWTFNLAPATWSGETILIIKAAAQDLPTLAANLAAWTVPAELNDDPAATQKRLLDFIAAARRDAPASPDLAYFVNTVLAAAGDGSPAWNGILYLNVFVPANGLPPEIRGLAGGFPDDANLPAHHMGINSSAFRLHQGAIVPSNSSAFGLVTYDGAAFRKSFTRDDAYDFKVLSLRAEVVNSVLVSFSSSIELIINQLFGEKATLQSGTSADKNAIVLEGQFQRHGGGNSFTFTFKGANRFDVTSDIVSSVTVTNAEFVTLPGATGPDGFPVISSQFVLGGDLAFRQPAGFDPLSFGGEDSSLDFDNLLISIEQAQGKPAKFFFDAGQIVFDPSSSVARPKSLYEQFPLALNGMRQGATPKGQTVTPATLGFIPAKSPDGSDPTVDPPDIWFGLLSHLSLGSAGALAPLVNFTAQLLTTWAPGRKNPLNWLRLPNNGGKSISIEGPIELTLNDLAFAYDDTTSQSILLFRDPLFGYFGVPFFGLGSGLTIVIFGNPEPKGTKTLGWYTTLRSSKQSLPGGGKLSAKSFLTVDFFGLSQNLLLRGSTEAAQSVDGAIEQLQKTFFPLASSGKNPLESLPALKFSGTGNWLIGMKATFANFISFSFVFADPRLYGMNIALAGDLFKKLKGLQLEGIYNNINERSGFYHFVARLDRTFEIGVLELTVPAIAVDVFSNGDYRVDIGFPEDLDFDRAFALRAELLTGKGGFFFGQYRAVNSPIPQPTNGAFSPITKFGVALSLGYEFKFPKKEEKKEGGDGGNGGDGGGEDPVPEKKEETKTSVISGNVRIAFIGIIEGVVAPFTPNDGAVAPENYYRITGTLAVIGSIQGTINLRIITIKLSATLTARATFIFEAHEPTRVEIELTIEASVSFTIAFFTISISFKASIKLPLTIGSRTRSPWVLPETSDSLIEAFTLRSQRPRLSRTRLTPLEVQRLTDGGGSRQPDFTPVPVRGGRIVPVPIALMPALTVGRPETSEERASLQVVLLLLAQNSIDAAARNSREVLQTVTANAEEAPFNLLAASMLLWSIAAQTGRDPNAALVQASDLAAIATYLSDPTNRDSAFPYARISQFLSLNHKLTIQHPMTGSGAVDLRDGRLLEENEQLPGTIFPMAPPLVMTPKGLPPRDFTSYHSVNSDYIAAFQKYFDDLEIEAREAADGPRGLQDVAPGGTQSFASVIFSDYFGLLATEATRAAADLLEAYPFEPTGGTGFKGGPVETLQSISDSFPKTSVEYLTREGDTLLSVATVLRVPVAELRQRNESLRGLDALDPLPANSVVVAEAGPTVPAIVENNPNYPLALKPYPVSLPFPSLPYQIRSDDTLRSIASSFDLAGPTFLFPDDGENQNSPSLLAPGATMQVPGKGAYRIRPDDSFLSIARHFAPNDPQPQLDAIVEFNGGTTEILKPLGMLLRPPFRYFFEERDSLGSVAAKFDLTLDELALIGATAPGILTTYTPDLDPLVIPNVAARKTDDLVRDLVAFKRFNNLAAFASRILLSGVRAPAISPTGAADFKTFNPLYDTIGQQFPAPPQLGATYPVEFSTDGSVNWVCLQPSGTKGPEGCAGSIEVPLGPSFFAEAPGATLNPGIFYGPTALQLYDELPPRYSLPQSVQWQNASLIELPGATAGAGGLTLWPFPDALRTAIGATKRPFGPFELVAIDNDSSTSVLENYSWATAVPIRIRQAPSISGEVLPNSYGILGGSQSTRELLLEAIEALDGSSQTARLYLLHDPEGSSPNPTGLISDVLDPSRTFVLQTSLTTVSQSGASRSGAPEDFFAFLGNPRAFLRLVLEASITGGGGYYLNYATRAGEGLPESIFGGDGAEADVWLVLLLEEQSRLRNPDRRLYPFNTSVALVGNPGPAANGLYVSQPNGTLQRQAIVGPGIGGFALARTNPSASGDGPTDATRKLYSILGYRLVPNEPLFDGSNEGLPAGPIDGPPVAKGEWFYRETLPVARFGKVNDAPQSAALPDAAANPYRGIAAPSGKLGNALVKLTFHDVYGNSTAVDPPLGTLSLPVGYTDAVIPLSAWPAASFGYRFESGPTLSTTLSLDVAQFLPDSSRSAAAAQQSASAAARQWAAVHYQVQQRDVRFTLTSNLGTPAIDADELKASLLAFVSKANVFAAAASSLTGVTASTSAIPFGEFAAQLSLTPGALATANSSLALSDLFARPVINPQFVVATEKDTLLTLAGKLAAGVTPSLPQACPADAPPCGQSAQDTRSPEAALTPEQVAAMNATAPLTPGVVIGVLQQRFTARDKPPSQSSMAALAAEVNSTVYSVFTGPPTDTGPLGLYPQNMNMAGLIRKQTIRLRGQAVEADEKSTLHGLYADFRKLDPKLYKDEEEFANDIAALQRLFTNPVTLAYNSFVVPATRPFSLSEFKPADGSLKAIADFNARVPNLFLAGSPIYLGYRCCKPEKGETIAAFALQAGITTGQFGAVNAVTPLNAKQTLVVPGVAAYTPGQPLYAPYTPKSDDSLQSIREIFPAGEPSIATLNRFLRGIFRSGATFELIGRKITPAPLDSLDTIFAVAAQERPGLTYEEFITLLAPIPKIYRTNGIVVAPAPVPQGASINDLAKRLNVAAGSLLTANASLRGFLRSGKKIAAPGAKPLDIGGYETINSVIARFAAGGITVTISDLIAANGDTPGLLSDQPVLLAPGPSRIDSGFKAAVPPKGETSEERFIFPVNVGVRIDRSLPQLVHPQFASVPAVASAASELAPIASLVQGSYVLDEFAEAFETAFAPFRLKCAVSRGTGKATQRGAQIYAVNFGEGGVQSVQVLAAAPQFYSLPPLSTSLIAGPARFRPYVPGCGLCINEITKNFDSVDLDNWMQQLLATIDLTLTAPYAVPAFLSAAAGGTTPAPAPPAAQIGPVGFGIDPASVGTAGCEGCGAVAAVGSSEFNALVQAKGEIARGLRNRIEPILESGAKEGPAFEVARDTLYQQLLVRLADAYTVNSVVQFPVTVVQSFRPAGDRSQPPRLAGKVAPVQYRIPGDAGGDPPATSIAAVAGIFGISPTFLAEVLGSVQGILRVGAVVTYGGRSRTIEETDTLDSVGAVLQVPPDAAWPQRVAFIEGTEGIGRSPLFQPNATFPLTPVARKVGAGDSLATVAAFIDRSVIDVGRGSQNVRGIFQEGKQIRVPGYQPYTVAKDDTLAGIAASLKPANVPASPFTVDDLSRALAGATGLFMDAQTLRTAILQPEVSFSTSKVSLGSGGAAPDAVPELTFLLTVQQPARQKNVFLDLKYTINQVEYAIRDAGGGFQSSSWLTFVLPLGSGRGLDDRDIRTVMPQTQVPIPLRAYPSPPLLIAQSGVAAHPQSSDLAKAKLWDYEFDARTDLAAQDTVHVEVVFTQGILPDDAASSAAPGPPSLFSTLAGFIDAFPRLKNDLALLTTPGGARNRIAAYALQALAQLADATAKALDARRAAFAGDPVLAEIYRYILTTDADNKLRLVVEEAPADRPLAAEVHPAEGQTDGPITRSYRFPDLDVVARKNAYGGVSITRNDNLIASGPLGAEGPTGPMPTNADFIYTTDQVRFLDGLTPVVDNQARIAAGGSGTLPQRIEALLRQVLDLGPQSPLEPSLITVLASFGFPAAMAGAETLSASTPIRLAPQMRVGTSTVASYAAELAKSIEQWLAAQPSPNPRGVFVLDLTVLSATPLRGPTATFDPIGPTALEPLKPVLRLRNLELPLNALEAAGPAGFGTGTKEPSGT
jgi:hypothetical protein